VGGAIGFNAPGIGPAVLLRPAQDKVEAFSRVCTHAGCLVGYSSQARLLVCPCHGAEFDPSRGAVPIAGPAFSPLRRVPVQIDASTRSVVLTS
jgi:thiosulfate dehydrogenase [quinone] large subunit